MREFDNEGLILAKYQGEIFASSIEKEECSSLIFLRRFFKSDFAKKMDLGDITLFTLDVDEAFSSINEEFGKSTYGKNKYPYEALYWLGYITRYISYTRNCSSYFVYKTFPPKLILECYNGFHTQGEEWIVSNLLEKIGRTEEYFDINFRAKEILRKNRNK